MGGMKSSPAAPKPKPAVPPPRTTVSAVEMGARQREISVSEFFTKNRHLLGFDSPRKALLTCVKEAVDNALDACEEGGILPDVEVRLEIVPESKKIDWDRPRGTQVTLEVEGRYQKGRTSVDEYLDQIAIANPHVSLTYQTVEGETRGFQRTVQELPETPREI